MWNDLWCLLKHEEEINLAKTKKKNLKHTFDHNWSMNARNSDVRTLPGTKESNSEMQKISAHKSKQIFLAQSTTLSYQSSRA